MKRAASLLVALALAAALPAADRADRAAADAKEPGYVVVDPLDFRKPIPEPEGALTQKYNDQTVRFTGVVRRGDFDKRSKRTRFMLAHDIVAPANVKGKRAAPVVLETVLVPVSFQKDEKGLLADLQGRQKNRRPGPTVTVQGTGHIMVDGSLMITDAVLVGKGPFDVK